jgi:hypothetical protein
MSLRYTLSACFAAFIPCAANAADVMPIWQNDTAATSLSFNDTFGHQVSIGTYNSSTGVWSVPASSFSLSETFTGGLISVAGSPANGGGTFALTVAGTSGGIPYFASGTSWASSGALGANQIVLGGGAGAAPSTPVGLGTTTQLLHGNAAGAPSFGAVSSADVTTVLASPPPIGSTTPGTGAFTTLGATGTASFTVGPLNVGSPAITGGTINALDVGTVYSNAGYYFIVAPASMASFGAHEHYGVVIQSTKPQSNSATQTGSWTGAEVNMFGVGGSAASDFFTGFTTQAIPNPGDGVHNLFGSFTGLNTVAAVPIGMTANSLVSEEADVQSFSVTGFRQGLRIADLSSSTGVQASGDDDAIAIYSNGGPGWKTGLTFGDATAGTAFPVSGKLITTMASSTATLSIGLDFTQLTNATPFTGAAIALPQGGNTISFGVSPLGSGGFISSNAASNGGNILFKASETDFQFTGSNALVILPARIQLTPITIATALAVTCNAAAEGEMLFIKDTVASVALVWHGVVAGGGGTAANSLATCNGTNWVWD